MSNNKQTKEEILAQAKQDAEDAKALAEETRERLQQLKYSEEKGKGK